MRAIMTVTVLLALTVPAFPSESAQGITPLLLPKPFLSFDGNAAPDWYPDAGSPPDAYVEGTAKVAGMTGESVAAIAALPGATGRGGLMAAPEPIDAWRGHRVRLSARLKSEGVGRLQMWLRIRGPERYQQHYYGMADKPVRGTTDWTRYEIVMDVAKDAAWLNYGFFIEGGRAYADAVRLDVVGKDVPLTPLKDIRSDGWQLYETAPPPIPQPGQDITTRNREMFLENAFCSGDSGIGCSSPPRRPRTSNLPRLPSQFTAPGMVRPFSPESLSNSSGQLVGQ
jgi:hypothetical protein